MSLDVESTGFSLKNFSWSTYDLYRPTYPPSLYSLIFQYHETNQEPPTPAYDSALDLGCGSGAASSTLAHYFDHLTLEDPSLHNLAAARSKLSSSDFQSTLHAQNHTCTLSFSDLPAEQEIVPPGSQDMVTMFEAIHWTDAPTVMSRIARALRPGGTVALVDYSPRPIIVDNDPAMAVWDAIWQEHMRAVFSPADAGQKATAKKAHQLAISQADAGLDFVPLDPALWVPGARRINMNCGGSIDKLKLCSGYPPTAANVTNPARERIEWVEGVPGWEREVARDWFKTYYVDTFQVGSVLPEDHEGRIAPLWLRLNETLGSENTKVRIFWPATLLLATRSGDSAAV